MSKIGSQVLEADERTEGKFMKAIEEGDWDTAYKLLNFTKTDEYQLIKAHQAWLKERRKVLEELDELAKYDEEKVSHIAEFIMKGEV